MKMQTGQVVLLLALLSGSTVTARQTPAQQIQNGKVEMRAGAAIDREIAAVSASSSTEPVWVAWRVPMIAGDRNMCSWYSDRDGSVRGMFVDEGSVYISGSTVISTTNPTGRPQVTSPTGPIPLEAGTRLVVLARVIGGKVERIRTAGDDCPMDAGGRTVYWLSNVTAAESVRYLTTLTRPVAVDRSMFDMERQTAESAVRAIGYHADAAVDAALDQIAVDHQDSNVRRQAASTLVSLRGAHGVETVTRLISSAATADARQSLVSVLGQSRDASAVAPLRNLSRDADAKIRAEAIYYVVIRGGTAVIPDVLRQISSEPDEATRKRAISAIGRLPNDAGVPFLLPLARTSTDAVVKKEAFNQLSQSKDPRAVALMEEILKK